MSLRILKRRIPDDRPIYEIIDSQTDEVVSEWGSRAAAEEELKELRFRTEDLVDIFDRHARGLIYNEELSWKSETGLVPDDEDE